MTAANGSMLPVVVVVVVVLFVVSLSKRVFCGSQPLVVVLPLLRLAACTCVHGVSALLLRSGKVPETGDTDLLQRMAQTEELLHAPEEL